MNVTSHAIDNDIENWKKNVSWKNARIFPPRRYSPWSGFDESSIFTSFTFENEAMKLWKISGLAYTTHSNELVFFVILILHFFSILVHTKCREGKKGVCMAHLHQHLHVFIHESSNAVCGLSYPKIVYASSDTFLSVFPSSSSSSSSPHECVCVCEENTWPWATAKVTFGERYFTLAAKLISGFPCTIHNGTMKFGWITRTFSIFLLCIPMEFVDASCTSAVIHYPIADCMRMSALSISLAQNIDVN